MNCVKLSAPSRQPAVFSDFGGLVDSFLANDFNNNLSSGSRAHNVQPAVNIYEDNDELVVEAELPGVDPEKLEVSINEHVLTLKGEKSSEHSERKNGWYRAERSSGNFQRSFSLPWEVDVDKSTSKYTHGVLVVRLPKGEQAKRKAIPVSVD